MQQGTYPSRMLAEVQRDHGFILEVVQGTIRWFRCLEFYRQTLAPKKPTLRLHALLLTGLYQLFYMDQADSHAVVYETVERAKNEIGPWAGRLVNAILRRAIREQNELVAALSHQSFAVQSSHPDELISRWKLRFDADELHALCNWNNLRPNVILRVNRSRSTPQDLLERLHKAGIGCEPHPAAPTSFISLSHGARLRELPGYDDGLFYVQDPSTSTATDLLDVAPGHRVLDLCAAPGGKTATLAEALNGHGTLIACDVSETRLARLQENLQRLQFDGIQTIQADALNPIHLEHALRKSIPNGFDRILLDVPCSNTGVLRRRPDARWRFSKDALNEVEAVQKKMLSGAARWLHAQGKLVYSTCSLEPEENQVQVKRWIVEHPDWEIEQDCELVPTQTETDGGYIARLHRHGSGK